MKKFLNVNWQWLFINRTLLSFKTLKIHELKFYKIMYLYIYIYLYTYVYIWWRGRGFSVDYSRSRYDACDITKTKVITIHKKKIIKKSDKIQPFFITKIFTHCDFFFFINFNDTIYQCEEYDHEDYHFVVLIDNNYL